MIEHLPPEEAVARARASLDGDDLEEMEARYAEVRDLPGAEAARVARDLRGRLRGAGVSHPYRGLDVRHPRQLEAALLALPLGTWVEVDTGGGVYRMERVAGDSLYLPGDLAIHCGDVAWAGPEAVRVLGWVDALEAEVARLIDEGDR